MGSIGVMAVWKNDNELKNKQKQKLNHVVSIFYRWTSINALPQIQFYLRISEPFKWWAIKMHDVNIARSPLRKMNLKHRCAWNGDSFISKYTQLLFIRMFEWPQSVETKHHAEEKKIVIMKMHSIEWTNHWKPKISLHLKLLINCLNCAILSISTLNSNSNIVFRVTDFMKLCQRFNQIHDSQN